MESVEPADGSTVSTVTARNEAARTGRTGGRAITPAQPSAIAVHSDMVTTVAVRCSGCHQGGPPPSRDVAGTETFGPAAEMASMVSVEAVMAVAASQPIRR